MIRWSHIYSKSMDQPGRLPIILLVVVIFPCPRCSRLRIWSRETGSAVPSRVSLPISILIKLNLVLTYGIPPEFRGGVYLCILNRRTPSGQSRILIGGKRSELLKTERENKSITKSYSCSFLFCFCVFVFLFCSHWSLVDVPLIFSVQQTTYRIGNHVYYWVWLRPDRLM